MENNTNPSPQIEKKQSGAVVTFCRLTSSLYVVAGAVIVASIIIAGTFVYTQRLAMNTAHETAQRLAANAGHDAAQQLGFNAGQKLPTNKALLPVKIRRRRQPAPPTD